MRRFAFYLFAIYLLLTGCDDFLKLPPQSIFRAPFPKKNIRLNHVLGDEFLLLNGNDTLHCRVKSSGNYNTITDDSTELFSGQVSRYRGRYYFSSEISDSAFLIYAVDID